MSEVTKPIMLDETGQRIAEALENLTPSAINMTIILSAIDMDMTKGQTIVVTDTSTDEEFIRFTYTGQPATIEVPHGLQYKVEVIPTLETYVSTDFVGVVEGDSTVYLELVYVTDITTFPLLKKAVDKGLASYLTNDMEIRFLHETEGVLTFNPVDYNPEEESIQLMTSKPFSYGNYMELDRAEFLYRAFEEELPAGKYCWQIIDVPDNTIFYGVEFTKPIPAGGGIVHCFPANFSITSVNCWSYESPYAQEPIEAVKDDALYVENPGDIPEGYTYLGYLGHGLISMASYSIQGAGAGGDDTNFVQWLLSDGEANEWWEPQHDYDRAPRYLNKPGFLKGVPENVIDLIDTVNVQYYYPLENEPYYQPGSKHTESGLYSVPMKFYIPSAKNLNGDLNDSYNLDQTEEFSMMNINKIKEFIDNGDVIYTRTPYINSYPDPVVAFEGNLTIIATMASNGDMIPIIDYINHSAKLSYTYLVCKMTKA